MGNTDSIPVVSQTKSVVQLVCGDIDGAAQTQSNFIKECPGVAQVTSTVQLLAGDAEGALETQKRCAKAVLTVVDSLPLVGHFKGVVHYVVGDKEGGDRAIKNATRAVGVMAGGAGGFVIGGPAGAVAGGMFGGAAADTATTVLTGRSSGYIAQIENVTQNPTPGNVFDAAFMPVVDGFAGYSAGNVLYKFESLRALRANSPEAFEATMQNVRTGRMTLTPVEYLNQANNLLNQAQQLKQSPGLKENASSDEEIFQQQLLTTTGREKIEVLSLK